jgi:glutaredoxin-like protein
VSTADRSIAIRDTLAAVTASVRLLFFERSIGCDSCTAARQLLEQLAELSPYIAVEVRNLDLDKERAEQHRVDRAPAIVVSSPGCDRIRFYGAPLGHELMSLLEAIRMTASGDSGLTDDSRAQLTALKAPIRLQVFFTPSCVYCPQMVNLANRLALESPFISATAIDATEYPDLVQRYGVNGVPKTIIDDKLEIIGAASEGDIVRTVLSLADAK